MGLIYKDIIIINKDYLAYMHSYDDRVRINHENSRERPNVAVMVDKAGQLWAIPMSSQKGFKDNDAIYNMYDGNSYIGHLKFNNMIPLGEGTYKSAFLNDLKNYDSYQDLLTRQQQVLTSNFKNEVEYRFEKAFVYSEMAKENSNNRFFNIYNNFELLKQAKDNWESVEDCLDEIEELYNKKPPEYETINKIAKDVKESATYERVLKYNKTANEYFTSVLLFTDRFLKHKKDQGRDL